MQEILRTMNEDQSAQHHLSRLLCNPKTGQRFTVDDEVFVLGKPLGDGAVGVVRKVTRVKDDQQLAVKFLPSTVKAASNTRAMWGWSIMAKAWRSASKRAITCLVSIPSLMIFRATRRRTGFSCSAR